MTRVKQFSLAALVIIVISAVAYFRLKEWQVGPPRTLSGAPGRIRNIAFSPDGRVLATGSDKFCLWDVKNGHLLKARGTHKFVMNTFAFSPDSSTLVAAVENELYSLVFWQAPDGDWSKVGKDQPWQLVFNGKLPAKKIYNLPGNTGGSRKITDPFVGYVTSVAFSPDGTTLAVGSVESAYSVSLWNTKTHKLIRRLPPTMEEISCLAFSPDNSTLAVGTMSLLAEDQKINGYGYGILMWDWRTGKRLQFLPSPFETIRSVDFSPDGRFLVSGADQASSDLWNATTGAHIRPIGHGGYFVNNRLVAFSPDSKTVVCTAAEVELFDVDTGKSKRTVPVLDAVAFSPDGRTLAGQAGQHEDQIQLWPLQ